MPPALQRLLAVANLAGAALLLWFAAPLLTVGGRHPFEGAAARLAGLAGLALLVAAAWALALVLQRRRNARLFAQLGRNAGSDGQEASEVLAQRFSNAMHLLRSGIAVQRPGQARWWRRRRQVYQLPWYLFIGAPGAGKTTALLHSGLRFPLAERLGTRPVAGVGGTRQCDWWFTDRAVFIDTAGRYTTQDSRSASDAQEWQTFMTLLRRYRPAQPINGVIVTVSVPDLLHGGSELEHQAAAVDRRLRELRGELGLSFPVYLLVTKVDLLAGFIEFFGALDGTQREQPWGLTFDAPAGGAGGALPVDLGARLALLPERIAALTPQRLQDEAQPQRRAAIYHFAAQVEALMPALESFARQALRSCGDAPAQFVRSVHLSSGTQEGSPIDRVLGELSRSWGVALQGASGGGERGKAFFLAGVLQKLVIAEAALAGTNLQRRRRRRAIGSAAGAVLASALAAAIAAWVVSYRSNAAYVDEVRARVEQVTARLDPARSGQIDHLLPLYALLGQLAASGSVDPAQAPWRLDFGLFQGPRLARSAEQTYHQVLDRTLAPLAVERLAQAVRQESDPAARYEALRIALMLVTPGRLQREEVRRWFAQAFATAGADGRGQAPGAGERQEWLRHLDALLERNAVLEAMRIDDATVRAARTALAGVPIEQRVHERLLRRAADSAAGALTLTDLASPRAVLAFAPQDAAAALPTIAATSTRRAWTDSIEPALAPTIDELLDEASWVLGARPADADRAAREAIAREVARRHAQATAVQWNRLLGAIVLQPPADGESLARFVGALAAADSPLRKLLQRVAAELPPAGASATSPATAAYDAALAESFAALRPETFAAASAVVDRLVAPLATALNDPAATRAGEFARELRSEAAKAPAPFQDLWTRLAEAAGSQQRRALERRLGSGLGELAQTCRRLTADRFPFARDARRDMPYADFARVFGPNGLLDHFFRTQLSGQVDTRRRPWRLLAEPAAPQKAEAAMRSFEMAEDIRRLFFPDGAELPQLRLQLTPATMDGQLLLFSADIDGQLLRYENGPRRPKAVVWPGPASTQRVLLRILPAGPSGVGAEVHDGPWALLRVLQRHAWQAGRGPAAIARLEVDGRALDVEVASSGPVAATLLGELSRFRCPEAW